MTTSGSRAARPRSTGRSELGVVIGSAGALPRLPRRRAAARRRVRREPRRVGAPLPAGHLGRPVVEGQERRDLQPARPGARPGRRDRPAGAAHLVAGQRRAAAGLEHRGHDLLGRRAALRPLAGHGARARRPDQHAERRRASRSAASSRTSSPATSSRSGSTGSVSSVAPGPGALTRRPTTGRPGAAR